MDILVLAYESDSPSTETLPALHDIQPSAWSNPRRFTFGNVYRVRQLSKFWLRVTDNCPLLWRTFPLYQMELHDVQRALPRSRTTPLVILITDADSIGLFFPLFAAASERIRTLYVSVSESLWPTLRPSINNATLNCMKTIFLRVSNVEDRDPSWGSTGGETFDTVIWLSD